MNDTMTSFQTSPLTDRFGVEVHDLDLSVINDTSFQQLRELFDEHSALLFRAQDLKPEAHQKLAQMFGPIEDREPEKRKPGETPPVRPVSNETADGGVTGEMDLHTLNLKANQLWHIDSTFLPNPALCNILTAKVVTEQGGETELASTRAAWAEMPDALRNRIQGRVLGHNFIRSRERVSAELARQSDFTRWEAQRWPAVWPNPVNGREGLFIASHVYEVEGMSPEDGDALLNELMAYCTQDAFVYAHKWQVGDVLIWDQRAVLHRGRPWDYSKPRTLVSICCTMRDQDGLASARAAIAQ
ncbi:TauD/TfdA dioxygenase family protein [Shimia abyssi]|uniref:Alpha-ketoglutarate-dependent 2,4-dichlorophenoxyacetate dioxygenase n=1 Tax=Shimia abyssi TaxID=1662395 RepID=A0A2P8FKF2_9RHOB|nr:TauD/TfdA family dioxygenase [Shimia abyssi]PSL22165.1 alpha-ketoglutarate-dependent 2,4-dichlorophenoxyacetate dioxygenase [Shimia abyssi]